MEYEPVRFEVPPPPEEPTLVKPDTKYTTRLWGADPFEVAVSVTQLVYTAALPPNAPNIENNVGDRPWGIILVSPDDPLEAITATPLIHFPDDAPVLYVTPDGIPPVTRAEIERLGPTGIDRANDVDVLVVGRAATAAVLGELQAMGLNAHAITASDVFELADRVDQFYGQVQNPDLGVPTMAVSATMGGAGVMDVMVGTVDAYTYLLPATHWVSHMPAGLLWVTRDCIPSATVHALERRNGQAVIYVFGGPDQIPPTTVADLARFGRVIRVVNDDGMDFNIPAPISPMLVSIAFAKMWDPVGMVGWNITGPGHGFTLVHESDWQGAVASAILSHLGFHAPLLLTPEHDRLPPELEGYYTSVAPTFLTTPAEGPYNMHYIIGNYDQLSWGVQARVDYISNMLNRRVYTQNTGSLYVARF